MARPGRLCPRASFATPRMRIRLATSAARSRRMYFRTPHACRRHQPHLESRRWSRHFRPKPPSSSSAAMRCTRSAYTSTRPRSSRSSGQAITLKARPPSVSSVASSCALCASASRTAYSPYSISRHASACSRRRSSSASAARRTLHSQCTRASRARSNRNGELCPVIHTP